MILLTCDGEVELVAGERFPTEHAVVIQHGVQLQGVLPQLGQGLCAGGGGGRDIMDITMVTDP